MQQHGALSSRLVRGTNNQGLHQRSPDFVVVLAAAVISLAMFNEPVIAQTVPNTAAKDAPAVVEQALAPEIAEFLSTYRLGSGDVLSVRVFGEPELSVNALRLTDSGTVFLPAIGEIRLGGLTLGEIEKLVADRLRGRILVNPRVSVAVEQYRPFFMNGMVRNPGAFPYQPGLTVRKATAIAGGLHERASTRKIFVIRGDDSTQKAVRIDLDSRIFPGDVITVEESFF